MILEKSVRKVMTGKLLVVYMGQTSKPLGIVNFTFSDVNNQHVTDPMAGTNNWKFYIDCVYLVSEIYQMCAHVLPLIVFYTPSHGIVIRVHI